jgi:hypothetical protein
MHCGGDLANVSFVLLPGWMELHWKADMNSRHLFPSDAPLLKRFRRGRHDRGRTFLS